MVLYGVSENNWKGSMDIWHVTKAVSNYGGLLSSKQSGHWGTLGWALL